MNTAPCGFVSFNDNGAITLANRTVEEMLGHDPGSLIGLQLDRILTVASRIFHQTHFFPLLKLHNRVDEVYLTVRSKDGADLPVLVNAVRRERGGAMANDCIIVQMKERSEYEDAILQARKKAEAATRSKDEFLAVASHELRRPLASIMGWTQVLRSGAIAPDAMGQALAAVERGTQSMERLIEDLMDHARITEGRLRINAEPLDPSSVIAAALDVVGPAAAAKSIEIQSNLDPNAGLVSGDPERLQQVVWNLLSNAVKFTPKHGRIEVRLSRVNSSVEIAVSDTGKGITADFLPYVFDRFRQDETAGLPRRGGGLGLGMAISKQLVELHGGTIRADSPGEGQGSTFTVLLPVMVVHLPAGEAEGSQAAANGERPSRLSGLDGVRVLVVEDNAEARRLLTAVLERSGAQLTAVATAHEGLEKVQTAAPDVIVSDVELIDGDGYSFIESVRGLGGASSSVPAIALTAHAGRSDRVRALSAGFQMHLAKPVDPVELVLAISNLTNRANGRSE